jgi:hypothetical protein
MSFNYNPFQHIEVTWDDDMDNFSVYCHSCGGTRIRDAKFPRGTPIELLFYANARHVRESHNRIPEDFIGWSKY